MSKASWQPSASIDTLKQRAQIIKKIRQFFYQREYLEVETPVIGQHGVTDVYLNNLETSFRQQTLYLQTSPEYHMKRLLAAGSGSIFQLARVFRDDELGRWHNPEFTLLEWYKLDADHYQLIDEADALLQHILQAPPLIKKTYRQVFIDNCGLDPLQVTVDELKNVLHSYELANVLNNGETDIDQYLFLLMSYVVEPALAALARPVAVYDFPVSQAALAKINQDVAQRFEVYYKGVELANGFYELTDAESQQARFQTDNVIRRQKGMREKSIDGHFLQALEHGLPDCSGVALGIDRLAALALDKKTIADVTAFTIEIS